MTNKTGGQAFPGADHTDWVGGMTLRDYFACQSLIHMNFDGNRGSECVAENAYLIADAMIKERSK